MNGNGFLQYEDLIRLIESERNKLKEHIAKKGVFSSKKELELLDKYDDLLFSFYEKLGSSVDLK